MVGLEEVYNGSYGLVIYDEYGIVRVRHVVEKIPSRTHEALPDYLERQLWDVRQESGGRWEYSG